MIYVRLCDDRDQHREAVKWHIDDRGHLHIMSEVEELAAYSAGSWVAVYTAPNVEKFGRPTLNHRDHVHVDYTA